MRHKIVANSLIFLLAVPTLYCSVREIRIWPFAPFDMYSLTLTPLVTQYYLEGEAPDGRHLSLSSGTYLHPFGNRELIFKIFPPLLGRGSEAELENRIRLLARHYEERRIRGEHKGPPLVAIRLFRVTWEVEEDAINLKEPRKVLLRRVDL